MGLWEDGTSTLYTGSQLEARWKDSAVVQYDRTGATSAVSALQAATALLPYGGLLVVPPGTCKIDASGWALDSNVPIVVWAPGVEFKVSASVTGLLVDGDNATVAPGCKFYGGLWTGNSLTGSIGIKLRNAMRFHAYGTYFRTLGQGVLFSCDLVASVEDYCESNVFHACSWNACSVGVDAEMVNGTTASSLDQNAFYRCDFSGIGSGKYGMRIPANLDLIGYALHDCAFWIDTGGIGVRVNSNMKGFWLNARFECASGQTPTAGLSVGSSAFGLRECDLLLNHIGAGTWSGSNRVVLDAGNSVDAIHWRGGTGDHRFTPITGAGSPANTWEPWAGYKMDGDAKNRLEMRPGAGATSLPGIMAGDGTSDPDIEIYRHSAERWQTLACFAATLGFATFNKAGTISDADFSAVTNIPTGLVGVDTTNRRAYFRLGASNWRYTTLFPTSLLTTTTTSLTPDPWANRYYRINMSGNTTVSNPGGSTAAIDGQEIEIVFTDTAGARTITWGAKYKGIGSLPGNSVANQRASMRFQYNATEDTWDLIASTAWAA